MGDRAGKRPVAGSDDRLAGKREKCFRLIGHPALVLSERDPEHGMARPFFELWGLGRETVRKLVKDDPEVIKIRMGRKKAHTVYSVPESAAERIHTRLLNSN